MRLLPTSIFDTKIVRIEGFDTALALAREASNREAFLAADPIQITAKI